MPKILFLKVKHTKSTEGRRKGEGGRDAGRHGVAPAKRCASPPERRCLSQACSTQAETLKGAGTAGMACKGRGVSFTGVRTVAKAGKAGLEKNFTIEVPQDLADSERLSEGRERLALRCLTAGLPGMDFGMKYHNSTFK